jgi:hypothetical protein
MELNSGFVALFHTVDACSIISSKQLVNFDIPNAINMGIKSSAVRNSIEKAFRNCAGDRQDHACPAWEQSFVCTH